MMHLDTKRYMKPQSFDMSNNVQMQKILGIIEKISKTDINLVIVGEQGTGKERLARLIHQSSIRAHKPFWPIDSDSISSDSIEKELFGYEAITRDGITINRGAFE